MSTQQPKSKNTRNSARQLKQGVPSSRSVVSENEAYNGTEHQPSGHTKQKHNRKSTSKKQQESQDIAVQSDGPSQMSITAPLRTQATPIKQQAYAGPTFHQSPAASALPLPSFYSKSLPSAGLPNSAANSINHPVPLASAQSRPTSAADAEPPKRESTPLDFLFDAARKAQVTPGHESPQYRYPSPAGYSPATGSPAIRESETQFPFEFESVDSNHDVIGPGLTTPYKERIEAARSARNTPAAGLPLEESERQAKAAALKNFLRQSTRNTDGSADNPFNAKPAPSPPAMSSDRYSHSQGMGYHSNPGTPTRNGYSYANNQQYFPPIVLNQNGVASPAQRPPSSNLRNIYSPEMGRIPAELASGEGFQQPRISTAREYSHSDQQQNPAYSETQRQTSLHEHKKGHEAKPSVQQMEDDLRRVLKLDLIGSG